MLRHNDDSVMAMLEAFVYDPLINWRLLVRPPTEDLGSRARSDHFISTCVDAMGQDFTERNCHPDDEHNATSTNHPASILGTPHLHGASSLFLLSSSLTSTSRRSRVEPVHHDERALNERAIAVLRRVKAKLLGSDFQEEKADVGTQVNLLVLEAQSNLNLCQLYVGWCV